MSQEEDGVMVTIVDEREERMVSHTGTGPTTVRLARFLKPSLISPIDEAAAPPEINHHEKHASLDVDFKGWRTPQRKWKEWVDQLKPTYGPIWKEIGIFDPIVCSTYEFKRDRGLVAGLAEWWCPDTNTFVFPWGEATITLEDVLILGGFSVLGEPVTSPMTGKLIEVEQEMIVEYKEVARSKAHKAQHSSWITHFMGSDSHLEHTAFLALWLSRYVLATKPGDIVSKQVFPIAIHLSHSTRIALAPAVLGSLYRDLRVLKEHIDVSSTTEDCNSDDLFATVWAPFQIMQLWAWERFPSLQPTPNSLGPGDPRATRWHKLKSKSKIDLVRTTLNAPDDFQWRPYSYVLENWQYPLCFNEQGEWVIINPNTSEELSSFPLFFKPSELVGLDCIEQYVPHRVAMQFGMDQDIPAPFSRANLNSELAWRTYDEPKRKISFYIPPHIFDSNVTQRYLEWWRNKSISTKHGEIKRISESSISPPRAASKQRRGQKSSDDEDRMPMSEWYKDQDSSSKYLSSAKVESSSSTTKKKEKSNKKRKLMKGATNNMEDDKDARSKDSDGICPETYHHEGVADTAWLELEERVIKLETVVNTLKEKQRLALEAE